jgi:hypothetical protein
MAEVSPSGWNPRPRKPKFIGQTGLSIREMRGVLGTEFWGQEGVKKLTNVHIQLLLRLSLSYTVQA